MRGIFIDANTAPAIIDNIEVGDSVISNITDTKILELLANGEIEVSAAGKEIIEEVKPAVDETKQYVSFLYEETETQIIKKYTVHDIVIVPDDVQISITEQDLMNIETNRQLSDMDLRLMELEEKTNG